MTNSIVSNIVLNGLALDVYLGWPQEERLQQQTVLMDIKIQFEHPPRACETDELDDTYCYDHLIQILKKEIASRHFRLIEHLGHEIYRIIKNRIKTHSSIAVNISKKPYIENLTGGVSFYYGDEG